MFVSHNDGKTTTTIRVNVVRDLGWACAFLIIGAILVLESITHPVQHIWMLSIGLLLLLAGIGLADATLRLVKRSWHAYDKATSWKDI
jgi:sulfite exporter TauE/SafE